jgi:alpha 1,3-glucosidase
MFAFGYHQSRWSYYSSNEIREVSSNLDKALIPHDSLWLDVDHTDNKKYFTFEPHKYGDIRKLSKDLMKVKRRLIALIDPHLKANRHYQIFVEAKENNFLIKTPDGRKNFVGNCWPGKSGWVDFLNPEAREWWSNQYSFKTYKGSNRYLFTWNDMNEPAVFDQPDCSVPRDTLHFEGIEDRAVHNLYGHFMIFATYQGQMNRNPNHDERPFILTRSFFSGSQKYAFTWTGDNTADWDHLRNSIPQILSLGISGFPFIGADVGGFFNSPDSELLTRWYQVGAFCYPFFRCHCHHLSARREPSHLQGNFHAAVRKAICDRYELFILWYTAARNAFDTGEPIVRPLWWEFNDGEVQDLETELIVFDCLLVAPILEPGAKTWTIYLPFGSRWFDYKTLKEIVGREFVMSLVNVRDIPVFIRGGKIIAVRRTQRKSLELMIRDPFELIIAVNENGFAEGRIYVDDGHTFDYQNGGFLYRKFVFENGVLKSQDYLVSDRESQFVNAYQCVIGKIVILGLKQMPKNAKDGTGKTLKLEIHGGNVALRKTGLPVKGDWKVTLTF